PGAARVPERANLARPALLAQVRLAPGRLIEPRARAERRAGRRPEGRTEGRRLIRPGLDGPVVGERPGLVGTVVGERPQVTRAPVGRQRLARERPDLRGRAPPDRDIVVVG